MPLELSTGALVAGRYRLDAKLGEGGMGTVWAATHTVTRKRYALKFLKGPLMQRDELRRRFLREARAAAAVDHPNVVAIHDIFQADADTPVMVMDLLEGRTLGAILREKCQLSLSEIAELLLPAISAVGTAHELGIVHRDLKPDNIFVSFDRGSRHVRVLDFGIAKLMAHDDAGTDAASLTSTGTLLGTPFYMSPEQGIGGDDVDHRTDVWAFGVILYEALVGARPVEGENRGQVLKRLLTSRITPIETILPDLPAEIASLIGRMLARERADRPEDLREVMQILRPHARVDAPDFGPPSLLRSEPDSPELASDPVPIHSAGTPIDAHSDTVLQAQAPSGDTAGPLAIPADARRRTRRNLAWLGVSGVAVAALVTWGVSASRGQVNALPTPSGAAAEGASLAETAAAAPQPAAIQGPGSAGVASAAPSASPAEGRRPHTRPSSSAATLDAPKNESRARDLAQTPRSKSRVIGAKPVASDTAAPPPKASAQAPKKRPGLRSEDGLVDDPPF